MGMDWEKRLKSAGRGAITGGSFGATLGAATDKYEPMFKTLMDPMDIGLGDAVYGQEEELDLSEYDTAQRNAHKKAESAYDDFIKGDGATFDQGDELDWQTLGATERLGDSKMGDISTDPKYKEAELAALRELEDQSQNGFTARDKADMARTENEVNRANRGRLGAIQQNMQARGMSGSGMDLVAQMQSSQDANEIASLRALERDGLMQDRKSQATMNLGQMSSNLQSRDFGQEASKARAADEINRFNTANSVENARYNNSGMNDTANQNWQRDNATRDRNTTAKYDRRRDVLGARTEQADRDYDYSVDKENRTVMQDQQKQQGMAGKMGAAMGAAGGILGGIYGGPSGAMAGQQVGSGAGQAAGNTRYRNERKRPGYYAHGGEVVEPIDSYDSDVIPILASPGEVIIPASIAGDPVKSAEFVALVNEQKKQTKTPNYKREFDAGNYQRDMQKARKMQDVAGFAGVAGNALNDYNNSQKQDIILKNKRSNMGGAPSVMAAQRPEFKDHASPMAEASLNRVKESYKDDLLVDDHNKMQDPNHPAAIKMKNAIQGYLPEITKKVPNWGSFTLTDIKETFPTLYEAYADKLSASSKGKDRVSKDADDKHKRAVAMRRELNQNPIFKATVESEARLMQVDELVKLGGGVKDEAILVMYQKVLDPGSVVREGEFARTAKGDSLIGRVDLIMEQATNGGHLTDKLRQEVVDNMKAIQRGNRAALQGMLRPYEHEIQTYGLDRSMIISGESVAPTKDSASTEKPSSAGTKKVSTWKDLP